MNNFCDCIKTSVARLDLKMQSCPDSSLISHKGCMYVDMTDSVEHLIASQCFLKAFAWIQGKSKYTTLMIKKLKHLTLLLLP